MVWLNLNAKQRRYVIDNTCTFLGFLPVGGEDMDVKEGDGEMEKEVPTYGFKSLDVMPLETVVSRTSSASS